MLDRPEKPTDWHDYDPDAPESLWGVGSAHVASGWVEFPLSNRDVEADAVWAAAQWRRMGVEEASLIDIVHTYRENGQLWPFYLAALRAKAPVMNGMATPWDVGRTEMYARRFDLSVLMGVGALTLEGLRSFGHDPVKVLGRVPVLAARADAVADLEALDLKPWRMTMLGPIILLSAPGEDGAAYDTDQWTVEAGDDGALLVTSAPGRAARYDRVDTGLKGRVDGDRVFVDQTA